MSNQGNNTQCYQESLDNGVKPDVVENTCLFAGVADLGTGLFIIFDTDIVHERVSVVAIILKKRDLFK